MEAEPHLTDVELAAKVGVEVTVLRQYDDALQHARRLGSERRLPQESPEEVQQRIEEDREKARRERDQTQAKDRLRREMNAEAFEDRRKENLEEIQRREAERQTTSTPK